MIKISYDNYPRRARKITRDGKNVLGSWLLAEQRADKQRGSGINKVYLYKGRMGIQL